MSRMVDPEETAALAVLAELGRTPGSEDTRVTSAEDEVEDVLRRLDLEAVGLLAYGLEPVMPSPAVREELLARLGGDETQEVAPQIVPPAPTPVAARPPAAAAPGPASPGAVPEPSDEWPVPPPVVAGFAGRSAARRPRPSRAPWLAAALAAVALGAAGWGAWLSSELAAERSRMTRLERDLARVEKQHAEERAALEGRLTALAQRQEFVSGPAALVFAMRPPAGAPQPLARAKLWVAGDHQHWQLDVAGLAVCPDGREYQVWFLVDGVPRNGGTFKVERDQRTATIGSARMPAGTHGVSITLERTGGSPTPTTPVLLLGDQAVEL